MLVTRCLFCLPNCCYPLLQRVRNTNTIPSSSSNVFSSPKSISKVPFKCNYSKKKDNTDVDDDHFFEDFCLSGFCLPQIVFWESTDFSVLSSDIPWEEESIWSTMGLYFFSLHIPLSFGGLSVIAKIMHQAVLDSQTEAVSILFIQTAELLGSLALLKYTAKTQSKVTSFLLSSNLSKERYWVQASAVGFALLALLVLLTSYLADRLIGPKVVNNSILKDIISSGSISEVACFLTYCLVTPILEEMVYRGFLLTSLASTMKWKQAVIISSCIFSVAHFSSENFLQLFIIGFILGCSYCWSIVVMDDVFCMFIGNLENICDLRRHYGLCRLTTEAMLVIEVYKVLRDRAPYPSDQVIKDFAGKFAFILFDAKYRTLFAARDRDGSVNFQWGVSADGSLVCSDDPNIISEACGRSCAVFPPGCIFKNGNGLTSFDHPFNKVRAVAHEDNDGHISAIVFKVDLYTRIPSIPRTGSSANWADTAMVGE
ncbi:Aluminum induced protein [Thalictrum thalictroides]|uniref:Aluminum induced protein n=1 Tax=Thalictrum thalictroides TaxID=46969 RepID=A0A7J6XES4_THATH|nr:Aluminum induced protein [Thalictrum thalictroides]